MVCAEPGTLPGQVWDKWLILVPRVFQSRGTNDGPRAQYSTGNTRTCKWSQELLDDRS
jgi:hypothetical protein